MGMMLRAGASVDVAAAAQTNVPPPLQVSFIGLAAGLYKRRQYAK